MNRKNNHSTARTHSTKTISILSAKLRAFYAFFVALAKMAGTSGKRFAGCRRCADRIPPARERVAPGFHPEFPIDIVYTWVDGADPALREKRRHYAGRLDKAHPDSLDASRYRDNDELRYSLRSLERFAPWIKRIFIVRDSQIPQWLKKDHAKIRMVRHEEIIPPEYLPTFNSHVIECYLHRIPGLSEQYIYFNDDFFLINHCAKADFFTGNGLPFMFCDWREARMLGYLSNRTPHAESYFNVVNYLEGRGLKLPSAPVSAHGPHPMTLSCANQAVDFYETEIRRFSSNRFRSIDEMAFYCHAAPLWGYVSELVVPCDIPYYHMSARRIDRNLYYQAMIADAEPG
ncbi:MAG: Stealth CR1 domain-containing protein [Planctomycetes bacterium]|nr:Stealth CR1 domain-containing protein [Planctomycetota bacterium]